MSPSKAFHLVYDALCGRPPHLRPWHFQWLGARALYRDLKRLLVDMEGDVLDVGCGTKPYREWFGTSTSYVGLDVEAGDGVDIVVCGDEPWPIEDASFDVVLCTQVLEHVRNLDLMLREIGRVLRPGARLVASVPFAFNVHGLPHDYRRFTAQGIAASLESGFEIERLETQGGCGSTVGQLVLNWIEIQSSRNAATRMMKGLLLPFWLVASGSINLIGLVVDLCDTTDAFYGNVILVARKVA